MTQTEPMEEQKHPIPDEAIHPDNGSDVRNKRNRLTKDSSGRVNNVSKSHDSDGWTNSIQYE